MRTIHFSLNFYSSIKTVGATVLGGLWALEWAWHSAVTNLRCAGISGICMPNPSIVACLFSEISAFIRTDEQTYVRTVGQTDMARSTRLMILIKNIYSLWGRKRFLLPVTYFPTNLVYPFTLRLTGIKILVLAAIAKIVDYKSIDGSSRQLRALHDTMKNSMKNSMSTLKNLDICTIWDPIIGFLVLRKLDQYTLAALEGSAN